MLGRGQYGGVFLAKEAATSKQMACKIVNLKEAAKQLAENTASGTPEICRKGVFRHTVDGTSLVMREIQILVKLSHVSLIITRY